MFFKRKKHYKYASKSSAEEGKIYPKKFRSNDEVDIIIAYEIAAEYHWNKYLENIQHLISNSYLNLSLSRTDPRHVLGDIVYYYKDSEYVEDLISEIITTEEKITSIVQDWNTCEKFVRYKLFDTDDIFTEDQFISANEYYSGCAKIHIEEWLRLKTNFLKLGGKK